MIKKHVLIENIISIIISTIVRAVSIIVSNISIILGIIHIVIHGSAPLNKQAFQPCIKNPTATIFPIIS